MKNYIVLSLLSLFVVACSPDYTPKKYFDEEAKLEAEFTKLLPYVVPMSEELSDEQWFAQDAEAQIWQNEFRTNSLLTLDYYFIDPKDSLRLFLVSYRDRSSLFEHYKMLGGMYALKPNGQIDSLEEVFISPRLTKKELAERSKVMFEQIVKERAVGKYFGDKVHVEWPYKGLEYDVKAKKWLMTPDNEMYWLKEMRDSVKDDMNRRSDSIRLLEEKNKKKS